VLRRSGDRAWRVIESSGEPIPHSPEEATDTVVLDRDDVLAIIGPDLTGDERRVLHGLTSQLAVALESRELRAEASAATALAQADALRTALLRAVSHDLRTPLASIKAASSTLLADDVELSPDAVHQLEKTIDEEADRLTELVTNLLGMSRLQAGVLQPATTDIGVDEVVSRAVAGLGERGRDVVIDVPDDLPRVHADPALLERALANVIDNALAWSPDSQPVRVQAGAAGGEVHVRVVDRGQGIPREQRERVFQPFQRLGDRSSGAGVGLGLAVARGFVEAMAGALDIEDTPGGGTTMVFSFPAAP
jgi:two-component system sensor histidine kinase KdpD